MKGKPIPLPSPRVLNTLPAPGSAQEPEATTRLAVLRFRDEVSPKRSCVRQCKEV